MPHAFKISICPKSEGGPLGLYDHINLVPHTNYASTVIILPLVLHRTNSTLSKSKTKIVKELSKTYQDYADRANVSPIGTWRGKPRVKKN